MLAAQDNVCAETISLFLKRPNSSTGAQGYTPAASCPSIPPFARGPAPAAAAPSAPLIGDEIGNLN